MIVTTAQSAIAQAATSAETTAARGVTVTDRGVTVIAHETSHNEVTVVAAGNAARIAMAHVRMIESRSVMVIGLVVMVSGRLIVGRSVMVIGLVVMAIGRTVVTGSTRVANPLDGAAPAAAVGAIAVAEIASLPRPSACSMSYVPFVPNTMTTLRQTRSPSKI